MAEREGERIYVRNEAGGLEPLMEERFAEEADLQKLLAEYPELLEGTQIRPDDPRRWILITREQGIPSTLGAGDRWSVDHLVIDQDAMPTLVEVKRGDNTELRRTVITQMLDYAAHAHLVSAERMRATFAEQPNAEEQLLKLFDDPEIDDPERAVDEFWKDVARNLEAKRFRLLFVADAIPDELADIVKFLNEQMPKIEVLAVEIKQFRGLGNSTTQTLVPRVIGRQEKQGTSGGPHQKIDHGLLLEKLPNEAVREAATRLLNIAEEHGAVQYWDASVAIRAISARGKQHTVALTYLPDKRWGQQREFTFGAYSAQGMEDGELRNYLLTWMRQFETDDFTKPASNGLSVVSYDDAVANIDLLADRLRTALTEIPKLSNDG